MLQHPWAYCRGAQVCAAPRRRSGSVFALVLLACTSAGPALAEVCDKVVGDAWTSGHGPVWLLNPVWGGSGSILTVVAVAALGLLIVAPRLGYVLAAVFLILAIWDGLLLLVWSLDREIFAFATKEGCLSVPTKVGGVFLLLALASMSIWRRSRDGTGKSTSLSKRDSERAG